MTPLHQLDRVLGDAVAAVDHLGDGRNGHARAFGDVGQLDARR